MGHSRAEKAESRKRILAAASTRIREDGLDGISVGELMKSVNLTHGGFYGHFASRSALIAAALEKALDDGEAASVAHSSARGSRTVKSIVNNYLSPAHRDHPSSGCAIPTLAGEVGRADAKVRAIMAQQLAKSFEVMGEALAAKWPWGDWRDGSGHRTIRHIRLVHDGRRDDDLPHHEGRPRSRPRAGDGPQVDIGA